MPYKFIIYFLYSGDKRYEATYLRVLPARQFLPESSQVYILGSLSLPPLK